MPPSTPSPSSPGAPAGPGPSPGFTLPDFASLLESDPALIQLKADLAAQGVADVASRRAAVQRGIVQFGQVPGSFTPAELGLLPEDFQSDLTPEIQQAAQGNEFSTTARINQAHQDAVKSVTDALAARGLLGSGETQYQLQREQKNFETGQYDASQKLLDYLSGVQSAYVSAERQRQAQLQAAYQAAMANQLALFLAKFQYGGYQPPSMPTETPAPGPAPSLVQFGVGGAFPMKKIFPSLASQRGFF